MPFPQISFPSSLVKHLLLSHYTWQIAYSHWGLPSATLCKSQAYIPHLTLLLCFFPNIQHNFHNFYLLSDLFLSGLFPAMSPESRPVSSTWNAFNKYVLKGWITQDTGRVRGIKITCFEAGLWLSVALHPTSSAHTSHAPHSTHNSLCFWTCESSCLGFLTLSCLTHCYFYSHLFHYQWGNY